MMEKLSRTKKYQELRDRLQNDAESQVVSKDLSQFQNRLNRLDVMHFDTASDTEEHDPIHARRNTAFEEPAVTVQNDMEKTAQYTFNNEYLDEYINEVKQYNKNKGLLKEEDTAMNILEGLKRKDDAVETEPAKEEIECDYTNEMEATIPFVFNREKTVSEVSEEVKNLVNDVPSVEEVEEKSAMAKAVEEELANEKALREQLQQHNKVIEEKIEDVEEDLEDMEESMGTANKILNVVLVLLIIALLIVLGVVVYWTLLNRGII